MHTLDAVKLYGPAEEQISRIIDHLDGEPADWNHIVSALSLGRNDMPGLLYSLDFWGLLDPYSYPEAIEAAWTGAEFPSMQLNRDTWIDFFCRCGYLHNATPRERPSEAMTLYRGAPAEYKEMFSWTSDLEIANFFAGRPIQDGKGKVWTITAPPEIVLACFDESRGESEFVVDTKGLEVTEYTG